MGTPEGDHGELDSETVFKIKQNNNTKEQNLSGLILMQSLPPYTHEGTRVQRYKGTFKKKTNEEQLALE